MQPPLRDPSRSPAGYRFGDFALDLRSLELVRADAPVPLQPQPARLLALLLARAGQTVSRDEIRDTLWGPDQFLDTEQAINFAVRKVRAALGDSAVAPRYLETVPRQGYRFRAAVQMVEEQMVEVQMVEVEAVELEAARVQAVDEPFSPGLASSDTPPAVPNPKRPDQKRPDPDSSAATSPPARAWRAPRAWRIALAGTVLLAVVALFAVRTPIEEVAGTPASEDAGATVDRRAGRNPPADAGAGSIDGGMRVAVLPLAATEAETALAEVISEELVTVLASRAVSGLSILSMRSIRALRSDLGEPRQIGDRLDADYLLHGSVGRVEGGLRLGLRLTDVAGEDHVWAGMETADLEALPAWYEQVANEVLDRLGLPGGQVRSSERIRLEATQLDPEVYAQYMQGRYLLGRGTREEIEEGMEMLESVIARAPDFAPAYTHLAAARIEPPAPLPLEEFMPRAEELARRAIELDPGQATAHRTLAMARFFYLHDWQGALDAARRAVELRPDDPQSLQVLALVRTALGDDDEAIALLRRAIELDPATFWVKSDLASCLLYSGRLDEAFEIADTVLRVEGNDFFSHQVRNSVLLLRDSPDAYDSFCATFEAFDAECPPSLDGVFRHQLDVVDQHAEVGHRSHFPRALLLAMAGRARESLDSLARACAEERDWELPFAGIDPRFAEVRRLPGFAELRSCFPPTDTFATFARPREDPARVPQT